MNELKKLMLLELLASMELEKAQMQFGVGNKYVYGFDDVQRHILIKVGKLAHEYD